MVKKSSASDAAWLEPKQVLEIVAISHRDAANIIMEHVRGGILEAVASRTSDASSETAEPEITDEPEVIPASYWANLQDEPTFWSIGAARFCFYDPIYGVRTFRCYGIRFRAKAIEEMFPAPDPTVIALVGKMGGISVERQTPSRPTGLPVQAMPEGLTPPPLSKHAGGAPKKDYWDDLWAAVGAQLYNGDLKPTKQADIEKAMLKWATDNDKELSEATARRRASKLWTAIREGS